MIVVRGLLFAASKSKSAMAGLDVFVKGVVRGVVSGLVNERDQGSCFYGGIGYFVRGVQVEIRSR